MVFTNCDAAFLPLDAETGPQVCYNKIENHHHNHHHHHVNALHRQNASLNLLDHNNQSSPLLAPATVVTSPAPAPTFISSNGYYGYVNNFSVAYSIQSSVDERDNQNCVPVGGICTDSPMCVDEPTADRPAVGGGGGVFEKRKRFDEVNEICEEPMKRCRFECAKDGK